MKIRDYFEAGVEQVWVIYPLLQQIYAALFQDELESEEPLPEEEE